MAATFATINIDIEVPDALRTDKEDGQIADAIEDVGDDVAAVLQQLIDRRPVLKGCRFNVHF